VSVHSIARSAILKRYQAAFGDYDVGTELAPGPLQKHRDIRSGSLRAAIFGLNDGLVSNVALVLGTVGAHSGGGVIRLAGLAGLFGGSFSMAAGEYLSMSGQVEIFERELSLEREELNLHPESELNELVAIYLARGITPNTAHQLGHELMADPDLALAAHAREELGIDPNSLGSPIRASIASFLTFAFGAFIPLIPFLSGSRSSASVLISISLTAVAALGVGAGLSFFTLRTRLFSSMRSLLICIVAGGITFGIGTLIGSIGT